MATSVIAIEAAAIASLSERIDDEFVAACEQLIKCSGRIVVLGMGKSGHIGGKIAATLASTGSPAFFVHPGEASHGDLGMITTGDAVLAISNSGETDEILTLLPILKRLGVPLIAICGRRNSTLAAECDIFLDVSVAEEACPFDLAPTASTTATLVMGDALSIALLEARGFTEEDFSRTHPAGRLGRRLLLHVKDVMVTNNEIPEVSESASLADVLLEMTSKGLGMTAIVGADRKLTGIFTDGDLRRVLETGIDIRTAEVNDLMTRHFVTINEQSLAVEAVKIMDDKKINSLLVLSSSSKLVGALNMHTLLRAGVV
ncbi:MAG: KpsF/GutQ family sugar-phosphate isomerase [Immundisolibacteraceae bacterium]|nr:KpsF/GutQ family sugar-phosphate isomerase [Immundisolibacteraceae bacterium]